MKKQLALFLSVLLIAATLAMPASATGVGTGDSAHREVLAELPDAGDPNSPDYVTVRGENGELEGYVKVQGEDGTYTYVPEDQYVPNEDVPRQDNPEVDIPNEDVPRQDNPEVDIPNEDVPRQDNPEVDIPEEEVPQEASPNQGPARILIPAGAVAGVGILLVFLKSRKKTADSVK